MSEIDSGALASVYRAVETGTDRAVALKVLKVEGMPAHLIEAFDAEVRALAAVSSHPNIVTLLRSFPTADGRPVLVLELCTGSYAQRLRTEGPLDADEVVSVGVRIAAALETAHRAGFLHRDLKPQNLLVTQYGEPALADFGVAALRASARSADGVFGFTTVHAPPEVLEGTGLSPATDVYGLASTLYQLLAGRAPFSAFEGEAPAAVILRILRDPAAPLHGPGVPLALSDLLTGALSKDPARRPQSAAAFAEGLRAVESASGWSPTPAVIRGDTGRTTAASIPPLSEVAPARPPWTPPPAAAIRDPEISAGLAATTTSAVPGEPVAPPDRPAAPPLEGSPSQPGPSVLHPDASPRRVLSPEQAGRIDPARRPSTDAAGPALPPLGPVPTPPRPRGLVVPPGPPTLPPGPPTLPLWPTTPPPGPPTLPPGPTTPPPGPTTLAPDTPARPEAPDPAEARARFEVPARAVDAPLPESRNPLDRTAIPELEPSVPSVPPVPPTVGPKGGRTFPVIAVAAVAAVLVVVVVLLLVLGVL